MFVLGGYGGTVRKIMLAAYKLGLVSPGYSFIVYELLLDSCNSTTATASENLMVCKAYEGILNILLYVPETTEYTNFTVEVRKKMAEPPFNRAMLPSEQVKLGFGLSPQHCFVYA